MTPGLGASSRRTPGATSAMAPGLIAAHAGSRGSAVSGIATRRATWRAVQWEADERGARHRVVLVVAGIAGQHDSESLAVLDDTRHDRRGALEGFRGRQQVRGTVE